MIFSDFFKIFNFLNFGCFFQNFQFPTLQGQFLVKKCKKGPKQAFLALFEILDFCGKMAIFGGDLANPRRCLDRFEKFEKHSLKNFLKRRIRVSKVKSDKKNIFLKNPNTFDLKNPKRGHFGGPFGKSDPKIIFFLNKKKVNTQNFP